ncbi:hypothetical protein F0562_011561 [Nyssa sinensis]|uniref:Late embryogenesis abundant protein LEA-2 subgroup domain-containing protein n=1 Tax=Nyssa sinensis TaxID=561372 RepID=A0A5J4ZT32_9ASTE|nr:hypothetical protein F0562_011561 [Nyssa sinensis]
MTEESQVLPLAPAQIHRRGDEEFATIKPNHVRQQRNSKCFVYILALIVLQSIAILAFALIVLRVKSPEVKLSSVAIKNLSYGTAPSPSVNVTMTAELTINNKNFGGFKYEKSNTTVSYGNAKIGDMKINTGRVRARGTGSVNVTVQVRSNELSDNQNFSSDISSGLLKLSSYGRLSGRVHVLKMMNKPMADQKEQVKPLAPAAYRISIEEDEALSMELKKHRHCKCINCCGCITALMLIQAVVLLVLVFTIFRVKDPVIKMNSLNFQGLDLFNQTSLRPAANMTLTAALSVKNPNVASFKFGNATTTINYGGDIVGEARNPPGLAKARRTLEMNVTVDIMLERMMGVSRVWSDLSWEALNMSSYTRIRGRVKILKIFKKHIVVNMNCTMMVNIRSKAIQAQDCKRNVLH